MNANQILSKLSELNTDLIRHEELIFAVKFKIQNHVLLGLEKQRTYSELDEAEKKLKEIIQEARELAKTFLNVTE
jgi:hypothetical protein